MTYVDLQILIAANYAIAEQLAKTDRAVAGLLLRGLRRLRELLPDLL